MEDSYANAEAALPNGYPASVTTSALSTRPASNSVHRQAGSLALIFACLAGQAAAQVQAIAPAPVDAFRKVQMTGQYFAEGANVGDFNRDGKLDVVSGPYWYEGPTFAKRNTIFKPVAFSLTAFADQFFAFALDVNRDGWDDIFAIGFPGAPSYWFENPKKPATSWTRHLVANQVGHESPTLRDFVGDGRPELVCISAGRVGYFTPDLSSATRPWIFHPISSFAGLPPFIHGLGVGDLNGDGRKDCITAYGWFEQPKSLVNDPPWPFRIATLGSLSGGAQMFACDVDGDGDNDVITSMNAHGYGLSWFENTTVGAARVFREHVILPQSGKATGPVQFSQLHAVTVADMDGDGLSDIVTGKTFWAHNGQDPGAIDPAVVYYFRLQRLGGGSAGVRFTPEFIATATGVGRQVVARDVDGDGKPDVVVGNKLGAAVLFQR